MDSVLNFHTEDFTCQNCGAECRVEFELPIVTANAPIPTPLSLKHCSDGAVLTSAVARLIKFQQKLGSRWVDAQPYLDELPF
jgi:hypothetical protein